MKFRSSVSTILIILLLAVLYLAGERGPDKPGAREALPISTGKPRLYGDSDFHGGTTLARRRWIDPSYRQRGRALALKPVASGSEGVLYYAADHLIVEAGSLQLVGELLRALTAAGLDARQPYSYSPLVYVDIYAATPEDVDLLKQLTASAAGSLGKVSLDLIQDIAPSGLRSIVPDDPVYYDQWNLEKIACPEAWAITTGDASVIVAVIDSGLSDFAGEYEGRIVPGYNFVDDNEDYSDTEGHGSAVTSVLAAKGNNGVAIAGICWDCRILPLKVFDESPFSPPQFSSKVAAAIDLAVSKGARVINMSLNLSESEVIMSAITRARSAETVLVTAAGNKAPTPITSLGRIPGVIAVGTTNNNDLRYLSNGGKDLDLMAPGVNLWVLGPVGWWPPTTGSSVASPHVAGVAALILSLRPELTATEVEALLYSGADDIGEPGWDPETGWGRLNARNSLLLARSGARIRLESGGRAVINWDSIPDPDNRVRYGIDRSPDVVDWTEISEESSSSGFSTSWTDTSSIQLTNPAFYRVNVRHTPDYSPRLIRVVDPEKGISLGALNAKELEPYVLTDRVLGDFDTAIGVAKRDGLENVPGYWRVRLNPEYFPFRGSHERGQPRRPLTEAKGWHLRTVSEALAIWGATVGVIYDWPSDALSVRPFYEVVPPPAEYEKWLTETYGPSMLLMSHCDRRTEKPLNPDVLYEFVYYPSAGDLVCYDEDSLSFVARLPNDLKEWLEACPSIVDSVEVLGLEEGVEIAESLHD